jgi:transcriptional regulator with XRE-family HTH domain
MSVTQAAADFGRLVRAIRKERKLKSWQVAERVNIEVKHLGRIERGEKRPSFELIIALAVTLGVSPSKFFAFESTPRDSKTVKKRIAQQLAGRDTMELHRVAELLAILFPSH